MKPRKGLHSFGATMLKLNNVLLGWLTRHSGHVAMAGLIAAVFLLYRPFLHSPILFDDQNFTEVLYRSLSPWSLRWLPYASMWWSLQWFGDDVYWVRWGNLALHAAVAVALYIFLRSLFSQVLSAAKTGWEGRLSPQWMAFFAALIFALHPVAVYGPAYMMQRSIVMATLFSLVALILYCRALREERVWLLWGSVLVYLLAVFSKEHAVFLPLVMIAITVLVDESPFRRLFCVKYAYLGYFVVACLAILSKIAVLGQGYEPNAEILVQAQSVEHPYLQSVLTQAALFFKYVGLWLLPNSEWMSGDMREPFAENFLSLYLIALLAFLSVVAYSIRLLFLRGVAGLVGLAFFFPAAMFLTELATVRIQEPFVLYRSYLWAVGGFACLPLLCVYLGRRLATLFFAAVALLMIPLSLERLGTFANPVLFWEDAAKLVADKQSMPPGAERIFNNLGNAYASYSFQKQALASYAKTINIEPNLFQPWLNMGRVYSQIGEADKSVRHYDRAIALLSGQPKNDPFWLRAHLERGSVRMQLLQINLAKDDFLIACEGGLEAGCKKMEGLREQ